MYNIGDKVETIYGACVIENHDKVLRIYHTKHIKSQRLFMFYEDSSDILGLYRTAHEKLIELGWENKLYEKDTRRYEAYNMWVIFDVTNKTYTINKLVGIAIICPNIDLTLSCILTQYLEELEE